MFAIEKNEADLENCLQNQRKFRTDVTAIMESTRRIRKFPDPDAIFIGGTGGEIADLIQYML